MSMNTYDTPPDDTVLQEDDPDEVTVNVEVQGSVRTEELPCETYYRSWLMPTGQAFAEKIMNADPKRKSFKLWFFGLGSGVTGVCIANNKGDAERGVGGGALIVNATFTGTAYDFDARNEVWARPILVTNTTGTFTGNAVTTDDCVLNAAVNQWAR